MTNPCAGCGRPVRWRSIPPSSGRFGGNGLALRGSPIRAGADSFVCILSGLARRRESGVQ